MRTGFAAISLVLGLLILTSAEAAVSTKDLVKAQILADTNAIQPGKPFQIGVLLKIAPQWHIYWTNSGEAGIPTTIDLHLPPGFSSSPLQYPTPVKIEEPGEIIMYGYVDQVMLIATITPPTQIASKTVDMQADANWLVCSKDDCIPGDQKLTLTLPVGSSAQPSNGALFSQWLSEMPVPLDQSDQVASVSQAPITLSGDRILQGQVSFTVNWKTDRLPGQVEWFPARSDAVIFKNIQVSSKDRTTTVRADVQVVSKTPAASSLDSVLGFTAPQGRRGVIVPLKLEPAAR